MKYLAPKRITKSLTLNSKTYSYEYYEPPTLLTNVIDESYSEYSLASTYVLGDFVKIDAIKKVYRAAASVAANMHPLEHPELWVDYGVLNSYRMLSSDEFINDITSGTNMVMEFNFSRCDTFAFVAANFLSVLVEVIDTTSTAIVYSANYIGRDYGALNYSDFYYTDYKSRSRIILDNLTWLPASKIRLTFSGAAEIGAVVFGTSSDIGLTIYGTSLKFQDKSTVSTTAITGTRSVLRYGSIRVIDASVSIDTNDFNVVANKIEAIIGRNVLWIPTSVDKFSETVSLGYIEEMDLPISNPTHIETKTTIIGVL